LNEGAEDIDSLTGYHNPKFARHATGPLERLFTLSRQLQVFDSFASFH